jgi:hypothetical protein
MPLISTDYRRFGPTCLEGRCPWSGSPPLNAQEGGLPWRNGSLDTRLEDRGVHPKTGLLLFLLTHRPEKLR